MARSNGQGYGATFTVQLPVPAVRPQEASVLEMPSAWLKGVKVLVIEDEPDTREMVTEGLEQSGATVVLAASGPEALQMLASQTPDVLVSDIGMPEMDGYELMQKIRSEFPPKVQTIPAVALTAFATDEDKQRSVKAGYQAYLVKPVTMGELINTVASLARRRDRAS
jgi:CheY-like chemotaxis protein